MNISPLLLSIRAIASEFASRIYIPIVWTVAIILFVFIAIAIWLVTLSAWWSVLLVVLLIVVTVFTIAAIAIGLLISLLKPPQSKTQKQKIKAFVDALQGSSEVIQTPKFFILFRLIKDTVAPTDKGFVKELSSNAATLRTGFQDIVTSFK